MFLTLGLGLSSSETVWADAWVTRGSPERGSVIADQPPASDTHDGQGVFRHIGHDADCPCLCACACLQAQTALPLRPVLAALSTGPSVERAMGTLTRPSMRARPEPRLRPPIA